MRHPFRPAVLCGVLLLITAPALAQYFGRNKVQYDQFNFQTFRTEHFEFFLYPEEAQAVQDASRMAERWYQRHSRTFLREFYKPKPIIFYANDADFQQTNAIGGEIGQGTGGVTESLKERVVMPLTGLYRETDHVLGHELVHSFQYDIGLNTTDSTRFNLGLLPLWLVEGMAEYLSIGRKDAHTAMWMRDAALRDDLPTMEQLSKDFRYFPYRYGQAYMAYIGGKYGDAALANLFKLGGQVGIDSAFVYVLGIKPDSLSKEWQQAIKEAYLPLIAGRTPADKAGRRVLAKDLDAGEMNLSPVISPDGKYVAFLSERDLLNINLFIADAETGEVIKRLRTSGRNAHFDAIRFISSAGSWSPDGAKFAFITFVGGDNEIALLDWRSGDIEQRIAVSGVSAITNVAWSPDGKTLAFSGLDGGISDLYLLDLETRNVRQLTNDRYGDLMPTWSPDGKTLAFVSDRGEDGTNFDTMDYALERIALIDVASGTITQVLKPFGSGVVHHNPQFSPDGRSLYFIADYEGFKDVYRYELGGQQLARITYLQTGVSGITELSPAMSVAQQSGRMMFSVFSDNAYTVYGLEADQTEGTTMTLAAEGEPMAAGILPPFRGVDEGLVGNYLNDPLTGLPPDRPQDLNTYSSRMRLDFVAPPSVGVYAGGPFGSGVSGGVALYFSDMLGDQNLIVAAQANGTFKDIGGQVAYRNQKRRLNYGLQAGHIPYLYGGTGYDVIQDETGQVYQVVDQLRQRIFIDQAEGIAAYPFTTTRRFELQGGFTRYGFGCEVDRYLISTFAVSRERIGCEEAGYGSSLDPIYFFQTGGALVNDFSFFGFTSPIRGGRSRIDVSPYFGGDTFVRVLGDYRRYFFQKPFTFAVRGLHLGNYGANENSDPNDTSRLFTREYLGYANNLAFVRGYSFNSFDPAECAGDQPCVFDRLLGTRIAFASAEVRLPLFGTEDLGLIKFPYLPTELALFADGGVAWTGAQTPVLRFTDEDDLDALARLDAQNKRAPVFSVGASTRFNLFGYMVLEMFYAYPFQRPIKGPHLGIQLIPGW